MDKLKEARKNIDAIDEQMAKLFEQRMKQAEIVAEYKKELGLPLVNETREKEVIAENSSYIADDKIREYYVNFIKETMNLSKDYQAYLNEGMKVAYSGIEGAFAHLASKRLFPFAKLVAFPSFAKAYEAVEKGECDVAVLPIENSFAGDVGAVMDLTFQGTLYINQILDYEIDQNLVAKPGTKLSDVKSVISHPQALNQCAEFLSSHNFKTIEADNTARAARAVSDNEDYSVAAIASRESAKLYGLEVVEKDINSNRNNTTRFGVFSRSLNKSKSIDKVGEHFILNFTCLNEAGSLAKTLNIIGSHGFNMRNLRSRPMKELMWNYYFYVELDGSINTPDGEDMLTELKAVCDRLKLVGVYYNHKDK